MHEVGGSTTALEGSMLTQVELRYLKAVFKLGGYPDRGSYARFSDIAKLLGVSAPTVSIMVRRLEDRGLLRVEPRRGVVITWRGLEVLAEYCWRIAVLEAALSKLCVPEGYQRELAERMALALDRNAVSKLWDCVRRPKARPHGSPLEVDLGSTGGVMSFLEKCRGLT